MKLLVMKRIAYAFILLALIVCGAQAYVINFETPTEINYGDSLVLEGTSNIPAGNSLEIVLYTQDLQKNEIGRYPFTIQSEGVWRVDIPTSQLSAGKYRLAINDKNNIGLGSSSTTFKLFNVVDRKNEIVISSPLIQEYNGVLNVAGQSTTRGSSGIQIRVDDEYGSTVSPEEWIGTDKDGFFNTDVPITKPGIYYVAFIDQKGLIRYQEFESRVKAAPTAAATTAPTVKPTTAKPKTINSQTFSSAGNPATFEIKTIPGMLKVSTSNNCDWIIEYVDDSGNFGRVNDRTGDGEESFSIPVTGGIVYVKVYPADAKDSGYATIFVDGASMVTVNENAGKLVDSAKPAETQSGSMMPVAMLSAFVALGIAMIIRRR